MAEADMFEPHPDVLSHFPNATLREVPRKRALVPTCDYVVVVGDVEIGPKRNVPFDAWAAAARRLDRAEDVSEASGKPDKSPVNAGRGKMSPQSAVGYGKWPDEDGRQSKHFKKPDRAKPKSKDHGTAR